MFAVPISNTSLKKSGYSFTSIFIKLFFIMNLPIFVSSFITISIVISRSTQLNPRNI